MSWLFSQVLVEQYLGDISSDGEQSVQSSGNPTQLAYCAPDKMTVFSRLSRFGMTYKPLTEDRGEALLTLYREVFHAKTSLPQEKEQGLTESEAECGEKWRGWLAKYDPDSCSWRTAQCSLLEDLNECLEILPRSGMTRDGLLWELPMLAHHTSETESGLWPTPVALMGGMYYEGNWENRKSPSLATAVLIWPTPRTKGMCGGSGSWELLKKNTTIEEARKMGAGNGGQLNPMWVEWLMGWPVGWTDLQPLETDKFQKWQDEHGRC
jgi:hypothetical protein